jgi:hypothetical protein
MDADSKKQITKAIETHKKMVAEFEADFSASEKPCR